MTVRPRQEPDSLDQEQGVDRDRAGSRRVSARCRLLAVRSLVLLGVARALDVQGASAFRGWCRRDPEVKIDGQTAHIRIAVDVPNMGRLRRLDTGQPVKILLTVPVGTDYRSLGEDNGIGSGYDIRFEESSELRATDEAVEVRVAARVPLKDPRRSVSVSFIPALRDHRDAPTGAGGGGKGNGKPRRPAADPAQNGGGTLGSGAATGAANSWISFTAAP